MITSPRTQTQSPYPPHHRYYWKHRPHEDREHYDRRQQTSYAHSTHQSHQERWLESPQHTWHVVSNLQVVSRFARCFERSTIFCLSMSRIRIVSRICVRALVFGTIRRVCARSLVIFEYVEWILSRRDRGMIERHSELEREHHVQHRPVLRYYSFPTQHTLIFLYFRNLFGFRWTSPHQTSSERTLVTQ